jgi:hypothetical protein
LRVARHRPVVHRLLNKGAEPGPTCGHDAQGSRSDGEEQEGPLAKKETRLATQAFISCLMSSHASSRLTAIDGSRQYCVLHFHRARVNGNGEWGTGTGEQPKLEPKAEVARCCCFWCTWSHVAATEAQNALEREGEGATTHMQTACERRAVKNNTNTRHQTAIRSYYCYSQQLSQQPAAMCARARYLGSVLLIHKWQILIS